MPAENPPNDLRIKLTIINPTDFKPTQSPAETTERVEVGNMAHLRVEGAKGIVMWEVLSAPNIVRLVKSDLTTLVIEAIGFGTAEIKAVDSETNGTKGTRNFTLQIGSVVIVGADGKHWRFFPDGTSKEIETNTLIQGLIIANAVVANLAGANQSPVVVTTPESYVTCYVLNLKSFKFNP